MILHSSSRRGLSLTEVLIAIFVMAIGMISLLVLFIVGLQNARWGLDSGRVAAVAANGGSVAEMPHVTVASGGGVNIVPVSSQSLRVDQNINPSTSNANHIWRYSANNAAPGVMNTLIGRNWFLINPAVGWTIAQNKNNAFLQTMPPSPLPSSVNAVMPTILVDPVIVNNPLWVNGSGTLLPFHVGASDINTDRPPFMFRSLSQVPSNAAWRPIAPGPVAQGTANLGIPRSSLSPYVNLALSTSNGYGMMNDSSLADEITFGADGQPGLYQDRRQVIGPVQTERAFTLAYLCRWADFNHPELCEVTEIVFKNRPLGGGIAPAPPGEVSYRSHVLTSAAGFLGVPTQVVGIGSSGDALGRLFIKGSTTAVVWLESGQPLGVRVGDWILDNTFILPEYDENFPDYKAPFLDCHVPDGVNFGPLLVDGASGPRPMRPGLCGGYFYKIIGLSDVQSAGGLMYQVITLDRPARSDGFVATVLTGVVDVIDKGLGRMPAR